MAFGRRRGAGLSAPRVVTFAVSLVLVLVALVSMHMRLPVGATFVGAHRFWIVVAAYALLALGVVLPGV